MAPEGPLVSVVVTGYRRVAELRRTVESFRSTNEHVPCELILADDGSPEPMQEEMCQLEFDRHVLARRNRGLAENANAGLAEARAAHVLQLQDDALCRGPGDFVSWGLQLFRERLDVGILRFTTLALPEPDERIELAGGTVACIYRSRPGSDTFLYPDHPHLKSREFIDFIWPYRPHRYMQYTEPDIRDRFNSQKRYSAAFLEGYDVFEHIGADVSHRSPPPIERVGRFIKSIPLIGSLAVRLRRRM